MKQLSILITIAWLIAIPSFGQNQMGLYLASRYSGSALEISELSMDVTLVGNRAISTLDFTFFNKMDYILEGEFIFPLLNGQSVYDFALDINGELQKAVVVEKNKGRESFEQIVREGVDPALLEQTVGNSYKTTIYPIPPNGTRRVVIGIEQALTKTQKSLQYRFPLNFSGMVDSFKLTIQSDGLEKPDARLKGKGLTFTSSESHFRAGLSRTRFESGENLEILIPRPKQRTPIVQLEEDPKTGNVYFWAEIELANKKSFRVDKPRNVLLIWDNSYSGLKRDHQGDKQLLFEYLKSLKNSSVELVTFNLQSQFKGKFRTNKQGLANLEQVLNTTRYDGATRWESLSLMNAKADRIIIVSDGIGTIGGGAPHFPVAPTFVVNSAVSADHVRLENFCEGTGGTYIDRIRIQDQDALEQLKRTTPFIASVLTESGQLDDLVFGNRQEAETSVWVTGKLVSATAKLFIDTSKGIGGKKRYRVTLDSEKARNSKGIFKRAWARALFSNMTQIQEADRKEAAEFACTEKIVTPLTSLIVLESIEDYVRFEIEPPEHMLKSYRKLLAEKFEVSFNFEEKLEVIVDQWNERIEWYETDFPDTPPPLPPVTKRLMPAPLHMDIRLGGEPAELVQDEDGEELYELSPFSIEENSEEGYLATTTLAGSRIRTNLRDVSGAISVVTEEFLEDVGSNQDHFRGGSIAVADWSPNAAYYEKLKKADLETIEKLYFELRNIHGEAPAFYFDAAAILHQRGLENLATRILSTVADLVPGNYLFQRAMGRNLIQLGAYEYGIEALTLTMQLRAFEPQSYFDLGLAFESAGRHEEALRTFYRIIEMPTSYRFEEIDVIALMEINRILSLHGDSLDASFIDERLLYPMPMDLRITLSWNADDTDVDLHVLDPFMEKCYYGHSETSTGGLLSRDITEGYGPEEFLMKRSSQGTYKIDAHYFGSNEQGEKLPVVLSVKITRNFSRLTEESETISLRLIDEREMVHLGDIVQAF